MSDSPRQNYDEALAENEYAKLSREIKYLDIVRTGKYQRALRDADIAHVEKLGWYLIICKNDPPYILKTDFYTDLK